MPALHNLLQKPVKYQTILKMKIWVSVNQTRMEMSLLSISDEVMITAIHLIRLNYDKNQKIY